MHWNLALWLSSGTFPALALLATLILLPFVEGVVKAYWSLGIVHDPEEWVG